MNRPFIIDHRFGETEIELSIVVRFANRLTDAEGRAVATAFRAFREVGRAGGLSGDTICPTDSAMVLLSVDFSDAKILRIAFSTAKVDRQVLFIVENMCHWLH